MTGTSGINTVLMDFDGVSGCLDLDRILRATEAIRDLFRIDPRELVRDHFYANPRNGELDLGMVSVFEVREAMRAAFWKGSAADWHAWWQSLEDSYAMPTPIADTIDRWAGRLSFVLVTDNHRDFRAWFARHSDFSSRFDRLVCSGELRLKKPDAAFFRHALGGCTSQFGRAIYLDDSAANVAAARLLGIAGIHVTDVAAAARDLEVYLRQPGKVVFP